MIFSGRRKTGHLDLEAIQMAVRSAMHPAGATALTELLRFPAPSAHQRTIVCPCGQQARYRELRSKPVLTAVGPAEVMRPYYLCPHCHAGQFPADLELDIEHTQFSPGVRRMQAAVGRDAPFDHGRQQLQLLAGLEVTAKSVERIAEAIGGDIAAHQQADIQRTVQLDLPIIVGQPIAILYVEMDGTGVPVVKKKPPGARARPKGNRPARVRSSSDACSRKQCGTKKAMRFALPIPPPTPAPLRLPRRLPSAFTWKPGITAGAAPKRKSSSATVPSGSGIWPNNIFPARFRSSICITPANTCGPSPDCCFPTTLASRKPG